MRTGGAGVTTRWAGKPSLATYSGQAGTGAVARSGATLLEEPHPGPVEVVGGLIGGPVSGRFGWLYWRFYRRVKVRPEERGSALLRYSLLVMLAFMITFRALPGHYLLAILPLAALVRFRGRRQDIFVLTLFVALHLGQVETVVWPQVLQGEWMGLVVLDARNLAILASFVLGLGGQRQPCVPAAKADARVTNVLPKPSLDWAVEADVRSYGAALPASTRK